MRARGGHQSDEPAHRIQTDPAEVAVPADGREIGDVAGPAPYRRPATRADRAPAVAGTMPVPIAPPAEIDPT